jgi:omega-6 fatty acid desaturase (delta-12 desaturase)
MGIESSLSSADPAADAARAWRASLPPESRRGTDVRGSLIFALSAAAYVLVFVGIFRLPYWWLQLPALLIEPIIIGALFVIGHDACHGSLTYSGRLNRILGRFALLPAWHPVSSWVHSHNTLHHGWTNFKGREPAFVPFTKEEYDRLPLWRRLLERVYRRPVGTGLCYAVEFYFWRLLFPRPEHRPPRSISFHLDRLLVVAFLGLQMLAGVILVQGAPDPILPAWLHVLLAIAVPWILWIGFMGFITFLQHTHPQMPWYDKEEEWSFYHVQLTSTAHVVFPWPIERILHNIMDHPAHHLDPAIPLYELPRSQRKLEQASPEHSVVIYWTPWDCLRACAACKLYDFERHCWTDFAGKRTSGCTLEPFGRKLEPQIAVASVP